jgi:hypothetical protein
MAKIIQTPLDLCAFTMHKYVFKKLYVSWLLLHNINN